MRADPRLIGYRLGKPMSTINPRTVLAFQWHHKGDA